MTKCCKMCGTLCSPDNPCTSKLVVPRELGGSDTTDNIILVCSRCSGARERTTSKPKSIYEDRDKLFELIDEYLNKAYNAE